MCQIVDLFENNSLPLLARCLRRGDAIDLHDYCGIVRAGQLAEKISLDGNTWVTSRIRNEGDLLGLLPYPTTFVAIKEATIRLLPMALVRQVPTLERVVFREALGLQRDLLEQLTMRQGCAEQRVRKAVLWLQENEVDTRRWHGNTGGLLSEITGMRRETISKVGQVAW